MSEANLWGWLRDVALPLGQYSRIESGDTAPGFPDVHCQLSPEISCTIELKFSRNPNGKHPFSSETGMRRSQIRWIRDNLSWGGTVYIIAEVTPDIYVIPGRYAPRINTATKGELRSVAISIIHRKNPKRAFETLDRILRGKFS